MPGPLPQHRTELEDKKGCDRSENDYLYEIDVAHPLTIVDMRSGGARAPGRTHRQVPAGSRGARLALPSGHGHYVGNWQGKSKHGHDSTGGPLYRHASSEEHSSGEECVRTCRFRWSAYHSKKKHEI